MNLLNCKNIKIPPVEDPVCVKINYKDRGQFREIYLLAINKYEFEYTKCNPGKIILNILVPISRDVYYTIRFYHVFFYISYIYTLLRVINYINNINIIFCRCSDTGCYSTDA